jgi:chromate transporter
MRVGKRALKSRLLVTVAGLAFVAIFLFGVPFPLVVLAAGAFGMVGVRIWPAAFPGFRDARAEALDETAIDRLAARGELAHTRPSARRALRVLLGGAALWGAPIVALLAAFGRDSVFVHEATFFSQAAVVTFGGAYAVLAYIAQQAVETYGWLRPGEMLDGLGLAETTPGPLIMVVQFVGFLGAFRHPSGLSPLLAGIVGSLVTVWVTFVPCFLWIFLGAPYIEALRENRALRAGLSAITAAVVGVILNLSVWFGLHVIFRRVELHRLGVLQLLVPVPSSVDLSALALTVLALLAMFRFKLGLPKTLLASAALGVASKLLF